MADDGLLGVSGGYDRKVYIWNLNTGDCLREISVTSFVINIAVTSFVKFICINMLDGTI